MDHRRKLDHAAKKIRGLSDDVEKYFASFRVGPAPEILSSSPRRSLEVREFAPPPPEWDIEIGSCLQLMRSSLDHLAHELVLRHTPTPKWPRRIYFPIFLERKRYTSANSHFAEASSVVRGLAMKVQPFAFGKNAERHPLWLLQDLNNDDKHRRVLTSVAGADVYIRRRVVGEGFEMEIERPLYQGPAREGVTFPSAPETGYFADVPGDAEIHIHLELRFGREGPAANLPVRDVLWSVDRYIRDDVFPLLEPFLS